MPRRSRASTQVRPPRQARSQATMERVLDATLAILDGRDFESIPLTEITEAARISASSLWARFPSKRGLLRALHERHLARGRAMIDAVAEAERQSPDDPGAVLSRCVRVFLASRADTQGPAATFRIAERRDPSFARRRHELDMHVIRLLRDYLIDRLGVADPQKRKQIDLAVWGVAMAIIAAVEPPYGFAEHVGVGHEEVAAELARMGKAYLDLVLASTLTPR